MQATRLTSCQNLETQQEKWWKTELVMKGVIWIELDLDLELMVTEVLLPAAGWKKAMLLILETSLVVMKSEAWCLEDFLQLKQVLLTLLVFVLALLLLLLLLLG